MSGTMALEGSHADEGYANTGEPKYGPVLTMMSKRLRALKKKYSRILQIEENKRQGKAVNKEQEDVLKAKIGIAALIDEYEKLRQPLMIAVKEEVAEREKELLAATLERNQEEESVCEGESETAAASNLDSELRTDSGNREEVDTIVELGVNGGEIDASVEAQEADGFEPQSQDVSGNEVDKLAGVEEESIVRKNTGVVREDVFSERDVADLLKLLYFAHLFDVRSPGEAPSLVWTRVHERSSCLSYDFVTDDSTTPLIESDLDALSFFGSMLTSRPPNETLSHRDALQRCIEHAREWLRNSDRVIQPENHTSYSRLRERLTRILSSEYFTMTPELQTVSQQTAAAAASAAGQYLPTKDVYQIIAPAYNVPQEPEAPVPQICEFGVSGTNGVPSTSTPLIFMTETSVPAFEMPQFGSHGSHEETNVQVQEETREVRAAERETEEVAGDDSQPQHSIPSHQHYLHHQQGPPQSGGRGGVAYQQQGAGGPQRGARGMPGVYQGIGGRNGGRLYMTNGRGGRGRSGMYPNGGRGQFNEQQPGGFQPTYNNPYWFGGGRGGSAGMTYNGQQPNAAVSATAIAPSSA
ncbi:uncharacterized protein [Physcomitrium patens]|uniref:Caprin-1 dimerization domain-containing protein n=1 Tax=Physcomitrium patens TaxID=3218 RepID=A0A2K1IE97_PHYPA|nr:uncharacterized protein LOC112277523 [Physcomitrium patens]PNR27590.1 hypothetical protein PHYPA_029742 [Physcomitrium patens]|eukprot:XP_024365739.1 uncharacterized protein LOC112277523 [Physcomitrella patens]